MITARFEIIGEVNTSPFRPAPYSLDAVPRVGEQVTLDGERWHTVREVRWGPRIQPSPFRGPGSAPTSDMPVLVILD